MGERSEHYEWVDARSVEDAIAALSPPADDPAAIALARAGGVDVLERLNEGLDQPRRLVNLLTIPGLDRIEEAPGGGLAIGPLVTLSQVATDPAVRAHAPALADAAGHAATPQVRQTATVGGNLLQRPRCAYFRSRGYQCLKKGGTVCYAQEGENEYHAIFANQPCAIVHPSAVGVALTALAAELHVAGPKGRRTISIDEFFVHPERDVRRETVVERGEILTGVVIPAPPPRTRTGYQKLGEKDAFDWPIAEAAVRLTFDGPLVEDARIVLGAAAPVPWRARRAEDALRGRAVTDQAAAAAAKAALAGATPLARNGYKVPLLESIVRRALLATADGG